MSNNNYSQSSLPIDINNDTLKQHNISKKFEVQNLFFILKFYKKFYVTFSDGYLDFQNM